MKKTAFTGLSKPLGLFFLAGIIALLSACEQAGDVTADGRGKVVAVGSQWYGHAPVWAGIERGIFEKYGFTVEWRFIGKSMDRLNAISSGEAQFASRLVNLEVGDVPAVFRAGNVDAALVWEPGFSQLKSVAGTHVLAMDTDTEIYRKFGTMTDPDVLILGKDWADQNPARAQRFMQAYFEALRWVRDHPGEAAELVHNQYIRQDLNIIQDNLARFVWHDAGDQLRVMSEENLYPQAELISELLYSRIKAIPSQPDFRQWVNLQVLKAASHGE
ncbi:MAG: ABC transporter substrate-binding protein [Gammaproteobacteria bacterium]